ncbi:major facilitator superfamily domain-containing protein [Scleroderma citrinum]
MVLFERTPTVSVTEKVTLDEPSPPASPTVSVDKIPDGGREAWCTALGSFLAQFCGFGYSFAFGVYQDYYSRRYLPHESPSAISFVLFRLCTVWIGGVTAYLVSSIGLICGPLHDRGYFYPVFISGAILQCLSLFMLSLAQPGSYYQIFLAQGVGSGLAQGVMYVPSYAVLSQHFNRRRALVMSIVAAGAPLGGIVHTMMLNKLINGPIGFKTGVLISAGFVTVLLFFSCLLMRTRYRLHPSVPPIGVWKASKKCICDVPFMLMVIGFLLYQTAFLYPFYYFQVDAIKHGLSLSFSFYSLVIVNAGNFCGRTSAGLLSPLIGVPDLAILSTVACGVLLVGMVWLGSVASFAVLGFLYGAFSGMNIAMMAPFMALLTANPSELGMRMGISFFITGVKQIIEGPPISGALLTDRYHWWAPVLFCSVSTVVSLARKWTNEKF